MASSAYEEFYTGFKERTSFKSREAAGKGLALTFEELASAFQEGATFSTIDEFRQMVSSFTTGKLWDYSLEPQYAMHGKARGALLDGALRSFQQGSPEKLNLVLTEFAPIFGPPTAILFKAMYQSDAPANALQLALQAGVHGPDKQAFLDNVLAYAVSQNAPRVIEALVNAGADANQKSYSGFPGHLLLAAARNGAATSTVKFLHDNGASFDDAIFMLRAQDGLKSDIEKLQVYQEKITGKPAPETDVNGKMQALLAEMLEMKREITTLKREVARLSLSPSKKSPAR